MSLKHRLFAFLLAAILLLSSCGRGSEATAGATLPQGSQQAPSGRAPRESSGATSDPSSSPYPAEGGVQTGGRDAIGENGVVSAGRADAARIGADILKAGGNAVDAAVAMGFALGVSEQQSSGIGGGGYMILRPGKSGDVYFIDFGCMAGAGATPDKWQRDEQGQVQDEANQTGALSVAVPGGVKGLLYALDSFGSMDRKTVMQPAIDLAQKGFEVSGITRRDIQESRETISRFPATAALYLDGKGKPREEGSILKNPDLAKTLELIAREGEEAFYKGEIAEKIVAAVQAEGGYLSLADFASYEIQLTKPLYGSYRGYDIYAAPLPSSGGTILLEMLNILENFDLGAMNPESAEYFHLLSEVCKLGFADRAAYMGDPAFGKEPPEELVDKVYAARQASRIDMRRAGSYEAGPLTPALPSESASTTSFSVIDKQGNMVTVTQTVHASFASGLVAEGTGILLNNALANFSADPDSPQAVGPYKRPLSSMSPTLILKDGTPYMTLGASGSARILSGVLQVITRVLDHGMDLQEAIDAVRMHDDFGTLLLEGRVPAQVIQSLSAMGHRVDSEEMWLPFPCIQGCMRLKDGRFKGAADPRREGQAMGY